MVLVMALEPCLALQLHARRHRATLLACSAKAAHCYLHSAMCTEPDLGAGAADAKECRSGVRGGGAAASIVRPGKCGSE